MPVQVAAYPAAIPQFTTKIDLQDIVFAAHINQLQLEVAAISTELGTLPKGTAASVKARVAAVEAALATVTGYFDVSGHLPESSVNGLIADLASINTALTAATSGLAAEVTARASADSAEVTARSAADTAEATARAAAITAEATARASADASEASTRSFVDNALLAEVAALPQGRVLTVTIGSTTDIGPGIGMLRDSATNAIFSGSATLHTGRLYLCLFDPCSIIDLEATGSATYAALHLRPSYQSGGSISAGASTPLGEVRNALLTTSGVSQAEPSGASLHQFFTVGSNGTYTFGVSAYVTRTGWRARLLSAGSDGDSTTALSSPGLLSVLDMGAV